MMCLQVNCYVYSGHTTDSRFCNVRFLPEHIFLKIWFLPLHVLLNKLL